MKLLIQQSHFEPIHEESFRYLCRNYYNFSLPLAEYDSKSNTIRLNVLRGKETKCKVIPVATCNLTDFGKTRLLRLLGFPNREKYRTNIAAKLAQAKPIEALAVADRSNNILNLCRYRPNVNIMNPYAISTLYNLIDAPKVLMGTKDSELIKIGLPEGCYVIASPSMLVRPYVYIASEKRKVKLNDEHPMSAQIMANYINRLFN